MKHIPWKQPTFVACDFMPEDGHSQQHAPTCRFHRADAVCICGRPLYDGHIEALQRDTPNGGDT